MGKVYLVRPFAH